MAFTRQGRRNAELMRVEERRDGRGFPYYWLMFQRGEMSFEDDTDLAAIAAQEDFGHAAAPRPYRRRRAAALRDGVRGPVSGTNGRKSLSASEAEERAQFTLAMRASGIDDLELLRALERAPRALFMPQRFADISGRDIALPIGCGQTSPPPSVRRRDDRRARSQAFGSGLRNRNRNRLLHGVARPTCEGGRVARTVPHPGARGLRQLTAFGLSNASVL